MKRMLKVFMLIMVLTCSFNVHAQLAVADGAVHTLMATLGIDQVIYYAQSLAQLVTNVMNTYQQVQYMIQAEQRALQNLTAIADVRSLDDFMRWQNRQLYMEREVEDRFNNLGVQIGNKMYRRQDIHDIPAALRTNYGDEYWDEFTEDQRKEMYTTLGLAPSNYVYVQTWAEREKDIGRRMLTYGYILDDEYKMTADDYADLVDRYTSGEEFTENQLSMNQHITQMRIEMSLRALARQIAERNEYDLARDALAATPPNPPRLSDEFNSDPFGTITEGYGVNK